MRPNPRHLIACLLVISLLFTCEAYAQDDQVKALMDHHFKALNEHNIAEIAKDYAPGAELKSSNWEGVKKGPEGETEVYSRYFISTPDLKNTVTRTIIHGNFVIVEYTSAGTMQHVEDKGSEYMVGKRYVLNYCSIFTIEKGKISSETTYFDQVAFLRQVGFFEQR